MPVAERQWDLALDMDERCPSCGERIVSSCRVSAGPHGSAFVTYWSCRVCGSASESDGTRGDTSVPQRYVAALRSGTNAPRIELAPQSTYSLEQASKALKCVESDLRDWLEWYERPAPTPAVRLPTRRARRPTK